MIDLPDAFERKTMHPGQGEMATQVRMAYNAALDKVQPLYEQALNAIAHGRQYYADVEAQRDRLAEALREIARYCDHATPPVGACAHPMASAAEAALADLDGGA